MYLLARKVASVANKQTVETTTPIYVTVENKTLDVSILGLSELSGGVKSYCVQQN